MKTLFNRITLEVGELNQFLLLIMMFLHKEHMGSARRGVWLRKKLHESWTENWLCFSRRERNSFSMCTRSLPLSSVLQVPWDVVGEEKPSCPVGDHETQVDVQTVMIDDHRNDLMLYVTHKKTSTTLPVFRERARSNSRSFTDEFLSPGESSCCTMLITSIPSPVDEATNISSICSQPVTGGGWEQQKLSSCPLLSYLDPFHLCFPLSFLSLLSKLSTPVHPYCVSIFSFILSSFSFMPLPTLCFPCPILVSTLPHSVYTPLCSPSP